MTCKDCNLLRGLVPVVAGWHHIHITQVNQIGSLGRPHSRLVTVSVVHELILHPHDRSEID